MSKSLLLIAAALLLHPAHPVFAWVLAIYAVARVPVKLIAAGGGDVDA